MQGWGEGWVAWSSSCSRNARPQKDEVGTARCPPCSQNAHDKTVLVRCAQSRAALAVPLERVMRMGRFSFRAQSRINQATQKMRRVKISRAVADPSASIAGDGMSEGRRNGLWLWNVQVFANLLSKKVVDLSMTGNGRRFSRSAVNVHAVTSSFPEELDTMAFEMTDQVDSFHEMEASGSRITTLFRRDSSAKARLDSKTSWTAS